MSDEEVSRLLSEIQGRAKELNDASNSINLTIDVIERNIVAANVGLECWLDSAPFCMSPPKLIAVGDEDDLCESWNDTIVGFAKVGDVWRLAIRRRDFVSRVQSESEDPDQESPPTYSQPVPLTRAAREVRIRALEKMPALLTRIRDDLSAMIETIATTKKLAR